MECQKCLGTTSCYLWESIWYENLGDMNKKVKQYFDFRTWWERYQIFLSLVLSNFFTRKIQATAKKGKQEQFSIKQRRLNPINIVKYLRRFSWNTTSFQKRFINFNFSNLNSIFFGQIDLEDRLHVEPERFKNNKLLSLSSIWSSILGDINKKLKQKLRFQALMRDRYQFFVFGLE